MELPIRLPSRTPLSLEPHYALYSIEEILKASDQCVLCGLCLAHCPTYRLSRNEAESPRGRISLIQALAKGQLTPTSELIDHLDGCLGCRACEVVCPSGVPYGRLIVAGKALVATHRPHAYVRRLLAGLLALGWPLRNAVRLYRWAGIGRVVERSSITPRWIRRLGMLVPRESNPAQAMQGSRMIGAYRGRVALFTGCTGAALDADTLVASQRLLERLGYEVITPSERLCCGAHHLSLGESAGFQAKARRNIETFTREEGIDAILYFASGCGAVLAEYASSLGTGEAREFSAKVKEITAFLADSEWPEGWRPLPLEGTVAIHVPCTQRNALRSPHAASRLLSRIPGLRAVPLGSNEQCCGAAGSYMLTHADTADALRLPHLQALRDSGARTLVSTNIGCALHLAAGAREHGWEVEAIHPIVLLDRQLTAGEEMR